jgi:hypothetical protein
LIGDCQQAYISKPSEKKRTAGHREKLPLLRPSPDCQQAPRARGKRFDLPWTPENHATYSSRGCREATYLFWTVLSLRCALRSSQIGRGRKIEDTTQPSDL